MYTMFVASVSVTVVLGSVQCVCSVIYIISLMLQRPDFFQRIIPVLSNLIVYRSSVLHVYGLTAWTSIKKAFQWVLYLDNLSITCNNLPVKCNFPFKTMFKECNNLWVITQSLFVNFRVKYVKDRRDMSVYTS